MPNTDRMLRVGDFAKATVQVRHTRSSEEHGAIYDQDLANKWISPRHPHIIESSPGICPICGIELVPSAEFGFSAEPNEASTVLVIPRDAVLMAV